MKYDKYIVYICCIAIFIFVIGMFNSVSADADWWNYNYFKNREIIIESDYVDNNLVNFPVMIIINDTIGDLCDNGDSIRFIKDGNITGEYYYEIEKWVDNEDRIVWVNITSISSTVDTVFYMYYNNSDAIDNQNKTNVWDDDYIMVLHLNESSGDFNDSTVNDQQPAFSPTVSNRGDAYGVADGGVDLTGSSDRIDYLYDSSQNVDNVTIEVYVKPSGNDQVTYGKVVNKGKTTNQYPYALANDWTTGQDDISITICDASSYWFVNTTFILGNYWYYIVGTYDSNDLDIYVNGTLDNTKNIGSQTIQANTDGLTLADTYGGTGGDYDAYYDELRISRIARNSSWINTTYNSITNVDSFIVIGSESESYLDVDLGVLFYNESKGQNWINHTWNTYYNEGNDTSWSVNNSYKSYTNESVHFGEWIGCPFPMGTFSEDFYFTYRFDTNVSSAVNYYRYIEFLIDNQYFNYSLGDGYYFNLTNYWFNYEYPCDWELKIISYDTNLVEENNTGTYWLNETYNTSNKNKGVTVNTSFTKDNNSWTQNVSVGDDDWLFISAFAIEEEQLSLFVTMTLFCFFFYTGYTSEKRSGGVLMLFSGFTLIGFSFLVSGVLDTLLIIPLLSPIAILIIVLGVRKWLYPVEGEKTKSEGT